MENYWRVEEINMANSALTIITYCLVIAVYMLSLIICYSYYLIGKYSIFKKNKISYQNIIFAFFIALIFLFILINSSISYANKNSDNWRSEIWNIIFPSIIIVFSFFHQIYNFLIVKLVNKNNIDYKELDKYDFNLLIDDLMSKNKIETVENNFMSKKDKSFLLMKREFDSLILSLSNHGDHAEQVASIACFNEKYISKFSKKKNILNVYYTYNLCSKINNNK